MLASNTPTIVSLELTQRCDKGCWFCYSHSQPRGGEDWTSEEVIAFAIDCAAEGVQAMSLGGGEPLQFDGVFDILRALDGRIFRSLTTNGLQLDDAMDDLVAAAPNKVHVSLHFPDRQGEVERVQRQAHALADAGIASGVNLLVARSQLPSAARAAWQLRDSGLSNQQIVYLPMRGRDTPTPEQVAEVAGREPFQSMSCLTRCGKSPRFCSVSWDKQAAWCSYTQSRRPLPTLDHRGLCAALDGLALLDCQQLHRLDRPPAVSI